MSQPNKFQVPRELRFAHLTVAARAQVSPTTVRNYLSGRRKTYAPQRNAIEAALRELGHEQYIRSAEVA